MIRLSLAAARALQLPVGTPWRAVSVPKSRTRPRTVPRRFDWATVLEAQLHAVHRPVAVREFRFDPVRRWRFDLAWPAWLLAVELHGAEWAAGRHNRGAGMAKDFEKSNAAQIAGWTVLHFTGSQVKAGHALEVVAEVLAVQISPAG